MQPKLFFGQDLSGLPAMGSTLRSMAAASAPGQGLDGGGGRGDNIH